MSQAITTLLDSFSPHLDKQLSPCNQTSFQNSLVYLKMISTSHQNQVPSFWSIRLVINLELSQKIKIYGTQYDIISSNFNAKSRVFKFRNSCLATRPQIAERFLRFDHMDRDNRSDEKLMPKFTHRH